jgi:hypothetical protein
MEYDVNRWAEHLTLPRTLSKTIEARQGVGWDRCLDPLDWIPIVVVMAGPDQDQMEAGRHAWRSFAEHRRPLSMFRKRACLNSLTVNRGASQFEGDPTIGTAGGDAMEGCSITQ